MMIGKKETIKFLVNNKLSFVGFILGVIFTIISTAYLAPIIASIPGLHGIDDEKPYFISFSPAVNEIVNVSLKEIRISYSEKGGSGINKEKSNVIIRSAKYGNITDLNTFFSNEMALVTFEENKELRPDAYNIDIELVDNSGNIASYSYQFYIFEEQIMNFSIIKQDTDFLPLYLEENQNPMFFDFYTLILHTSNCNRYLHNVIIDFQFPAIIENYSIIFKEGINNFNLRLGENVGFFGLEKLDWHSCYSSINIDSIAPNGNLIVVFKIDYNFSKYKNFTGCEINEDQMFHSDLENKFELSYSYQEYGYWYFHNMSGEIKEWKLP